MADNKDKCPFCGSEERIIEQPFVEIDEHGQYVKKTQPCCRWSGQNLKWVQQHTDPITGKAPDLKKVEKW